MIIDAPDAGAKAILGAMLDIALTHGKASVSDVDRLTIDTAAKTVLGMSEGVPEDLAPCRPEALAHAFSEDPADGVQTVRMVAVMSLVDGHIDKDKIALVQEFARALSIDEAYVHVLAEAAAGEVAAAAVCMMRKNAETFPGLDLTGFEADRIASFLPYRDGRADPSLEARYEALGQLGDDTFGWAFWDHFKRNNFPLPGNPNGLAAEFTTRHDTSHVLSGYSTSPAGELLVSTFIGAMHPETPMAADILPALFSYHLGIAMNDIASVTDGDFAPAAFWTAWDRGAATTVEVFDSAWGFSAHTETPPEEPRHTNGVPPVYPSLVA